MRSTVAGTTLAIATLRADEALRSPSERLFDDPYAALFAAAADAEAAEGTRRFPDLPFFRDGIRLRTRFIDGVLRGPRWPRGLRLRALQLRPGRRPGGHAATRVPLLRGARHDDEAAGG